MAHPKPHGLYRGESAEWKHEVVWVYYGRSVIQEVHPKIYRERGYQPPFENLPTTDHYKSILVTDDSRTSEAQALG